MSAPPPWRLRPAGDADRDFAWAVTVDAMRGYAEATWGPWDDAAERAKHERNWTAASHRIVLARDAGDEEPAGIVAVEDEPDARWLVKLYLGARWRGRGLGGAVLARVVAEAEAAGKPLRLRVLRVNVRAQALYRRHGFAVVGGTRERLFMLRPSPPLPA